MSKPESQVVEDIKTEEQEWEDQNYQSSSKAGGSKPRCVSLFLPLTLPLSSDATWSLAQVTALFNDAICLMPSCGCQSISHYPSSCLSYSIARTPRLRRTKEQRASPETSLQRPIKEPSSRVIGGRRHVKDMETTTTSNNKNRREEDIDGHIFHPAFFHNFPFLLIREVPPGYKLGGGRESKGKIC